MILRAAVSFAVSASSMHSGESELREAQRAAQRLLLRAAVLSFFVNILMLTGPLYMLQIYDRVLSSRSVETLIVITILTFGLFAAMAVIELSRSAILARAGNEFDTRLKNRVFDISMQIAGSRVSNAELPLRDLREIRQFLSGPSLTAVFDAPWSVAFLSVIFLLHWLLGLVATLGLLVILVLAALNERFSRSAFVSTQITTSQADAFAENALRSANVADAMGMRNNLRNRWRKESDSANMIALLATDRIGAFSAFTRSIRLFLQSAIIGVGAFLAINGEVTPGVMIAASIIAGRALAPIEIVTAHWRSLRHALSAYQRFIKIISVIKDPPQQDQLSSVKGAVNLNNVYFRPAMAKQATLKNINISVAAGETIGVIGPTGAGKSTLARMFAGVAIPTSGEIRIDGVRLDRVNPVKLGQYIGFLPQEVALIAGSIADNIARFAIPPQLESVVVAARAAGVHEVILELDDGYETEVGEGGNRLSAGQRQRIGLARALYQDPGIVVLDEPNSNLDGGGEAALSITLRRLKERRATVVLIAHNESAVAQVDRILLLVRGEVRAFGPREEVLRLMDAQNVTQVTSLPRGFGG